MIRPAALALLALATTSIAVAPHPYKKDAGPLAVAVTRYDWVDSARNNRPVPVKIYSPEKGAGPFPVIVFSHGLGGSREAYEYLGRHWASYGYVVAHLQHAGSDDQVWKGQERPGVALGQAARDTRNAVARPLDPLFHGLILQSTTAFWDAYLKNDAAAKSWLAKGGFREEMGKSGTLEVKTGAKP